MRMTIPRAAFVEAWQNAESPAAAASRLGRGVTVAEVCRWAGRLRGRGLPLKKFPTRLPPWGRACPVSRKEFIAIWNTCDKVAEVVEKVGGAVTAEQASRWAAELRQDG